MSKIYLSNNNYIIYNSRRDPPNYLKNLKDSNFTLHHIMPYCYVAMIGHIIDTLVKDIIQVEESFAAISLSSHLDIITSQLLADEQSSVNLQTVDVNNPAESFVHKFAWMGVNLFMGPEGSWRFDDPGHGIETIKPWSFNKNQWDVLNDIFKILDNAFVITSAGQGYTAMPKYDLDWIGNGNIITGATGLIPKLKLLCNGDAKKPHLFQMDDWVIVDSDEADWKKTLFKLSDDEVGIKRAKQQLESLEKQNKVIYYRPVAIKGVDMEYPTFAQESRKTQQKARDNKSKKKDPNADVSLQSVKHLFESYEQKPSNVVDDWKAFWRLRTVESLSDLVKLKANFRVGGNKTPEKYL